MPMLLALLLLLSSSAEAAENTRIKLWHQMIYSHREVLAEVLKDYEKANPGIQIDALYRETEELRSAYQSAAMGGSGPQLIYGPSDQVGPFAVMGIIAPLDSYFEKEYLENFDPLARIRFQDQLYMIGDKVGNNLMLIYNKDLISEPPKTTDEMIAIGKKLTKDTNGDGRVDQYGLTWNFTEPYFFVPWVAGFGEWFVTEDFAPNMNTEATQKAFAFIKSLRDEHRIIPKESDYEMANSLFKTGRAAMIINGDWSWGDYRAANINFGIARIPMVSSTGLWPAPLVGTTGYSMNVNLSDEERPQVLALLKYLLSPEVQRKFTEALGTVPSRLEVRREASQVEGSLLAQAAEITEVGKPMPVIPEIRAVWDSLRTQYQMLLGGAISPETAAEQAQLNAEAQIHSMNEVIQPNWQAYVVWALFALIGLGLIFGIIRGGAILVRGLQGEQRLAYAMMLPAMIAIFLVIVYPFFYNVAISFSNYSLRSYNDWTIVGFQHYISVFTDPTILYVTIKTLIWTVVNVVFHVGIGVILALCINETLPARPLFRVLLIIPWAVPQYITALTWRGMFNQEYGAINLVLSRYLHMEPVQWLSQPFEAFSAAIVANVWLGFPFMMTVALGALQSIPKEMYEAARVDGAGPWQRFRNITWPMIKPAMLPAITLGTIWTFNNLAVIWLVTNGGEPADQSHILVSYVYKSAFNLYRYGYGAALSMVIFFMLLIYGILFLNKSKATDAAY